MGLKDKKSTIQQRVTWLVAHPSFLSNPGSSFLDTPDIKKILRAMKDDGLYSETSYISDCSKGICEAVDIAVDLIKERRKNERSRGG